MKKVVFKEKQQFRNWEIIAMLGFFTGVILLGLIKEGLVHSFQRMDAVSIAFLILSLVFLVSGIWYFMHVRLVTRIDKEGICFKYAPWHQCKKRISFDEIEEIRVIETPNTARFNGWNVQFDLQESVYSVTGRTGIQICLRNGEKVFIGSGNPELLCKKLKQLQVDMSAD